MKTTDLLEFLRSRMSTTVVYQPAALGDQYGVSNSGLLDLVKKQQKERGSFGKEYFYERDEQGKGLNNKTARSKR